MTNLDVGIRTSPEVNLDLGPYCLGIVKSEGDSGSIDVGWDNSKGIGTNKIESKALHRWIEQGVPMATAGTEEKLAPNWEL